MAGLRPEVREFRDLTRCRRVLTDAAGAFLADHEVRLDASAAEYEAFADLRGYLRWHCAPDRRAEDEARIAGQVGAWIALPGGRRLRDRAQREAVRPARGQGPAAAPRHLA